MSRSSPSVHRVVAVLDFFADHPGQSFTLTDLVRSLKLSRATCHGMLTGLVDAGYLYRTSDKNYVLGPALLKVSEVARANFSPLQVAKAEMRQLADEFDVVCIAASRERYEAVVRDRAAAVSNLGYSSPRGTRVPLLPQFAPPFFAGEPREALEAWIDGFNPPCAAAQADSFYKGVEFVREHGYLFSVLRRGATAEREARDWVNERSIFDAPIVPAHELLDDETYNLTFIAAPVFDERNKVEFVLAMQGFPRKYSGVEIEKIGVRLREACSRITQFASGAKAPAPGR